VHDIQAPFVRGHEVVREVERAAHATGDVRREGERDALPEFPVPIDDQAQRRPLDELHGDEIFARHFAELIDLNDVAVLKLAESLASSMKSWSHSFCLAYCGWMTLSAMRLAKPAGPSCSASYTVAIPPTATFRTRRKVPAYSM